MNSKLKSLLRDWLPPVAIRALKKLLLESSITFAGPYNSWPEAAAASSGYDCESILEKVKDATLKVKSGDAVYERDSVLFDQIEYSWPVLSSLMWAAAQNQGRLRVLDFGGSLGSSYFQNRKFLHGLADVQWGVVEQHHYVTCGKQYIEDDTIKFFQSIQECAEAITPNIILLGSVLQYLPQPFSILQQLTTSVETAIVVIDRTPFSLLPSDTICVQHVNEAIYLAGYPTWIFSRERFSQFLESEYSVLENFQSNHSQEFQLNNLAITFQGMILKRKNA